MRLAGGWKADPGGALKREVQVVTASCLAAMHQQVPVGFLVAVDGQVVQAGRAGCHKLGAGVGEELIHSALQPSLHALHLLIVPASHQLR